MEEQVTTMLFTVKNAENLRCTVPRYERYKIQNQTGSLALSCSSLKPDTRTHTHVWKEVRRFRDGDCRPLSAIHCICKVCFASLYCTLHDVKS